MNFSKREKIIKKRLTIDNIELILATLSEPEKKALSLDRDFTVATILRILVAPGVIPIKERNIITILSDRLAIDAFENFIQLGGKH